MNVSSFRRDDRKNSLLEKSICPFLLNVTANRLRYVSNIDCEFECYRRRAGRRVLSAVLLSSKHVTQVPPPSEHNLDVCGPTESSSRSMWNFERLMPASDWAQNRWQVDHSMKRSQRLHRSRSKSVVITLRIVTTESDFVRKGDWTESNVYLCSYKGIRQSKRGLHHFRSSSWFSTLPSL